MNATSAQPGVDVAAARGGKWLWVIAALAVGLIAVSRDSLWVDEALTANEVSHASFRGMWAMLVRDKGSDLQMPLYLFHLWAWVKIFGTSEWALRAINIPWFVLAVAACARAFSGRARTSLMLAVFVSPFTWYFLNEARPYAMQISTSLIAMAALYRLAGNEKLMPNAERGWVAVFFFGVICLSASSLLGMIWAGAFLLAAMWCLPWTRLMKLASAQRGRVFLSMGLLLVTGAYYLWTLKNGARATGGTTDARNLFFIAYELLGFGGLGPGRLEIRGGSLAAFHGYLVPLAGYAALLAFVGFLGLRCCRRGLSAARTSGLLAIVALPMLVLVTAGYALHFRVLERHFAPAIAAISCVLAFGLAEGWRRNGVSRAVVCAFIGLSFVSCLEVRFALRQKKDDYRAAAAEAKNALNRGQRVWWNAGWHGAIYYELPISTNGENVREVFWVLNTSAPSLTAQPVPDVVISSKPDMFDQTGAIAEFLRKGPYDQVADYPAFTVWQRKIGPSGGRN